MCVHKQHRSWAHGVRPTWMAEVRKIGEKFFVLRPFRQKKGVTFL